MATRDIITGIDVGSSNVRTVICEVFGEGRPPQILGTGIAESRGVRRGYVVNVEGTAKSIAQSVRNAEKAAGTKADNCFLSAGGVGIEGTISVGSALVSSVDGEVTDDDVERATRAAEGILRDNANKKLLNAVPLAFRLDGKEVLGRPRGMKGVKLEAKVLVITALSQHINDLISAADLARIEVIDVFPASIAASLVALSKQQKTAGCVLALLGSETLTITTFENNLPVSLQVLPLGSNDITNDIALKMQIALSDAEKEKLSRFHDSSSKKELDGIIETRLHEFFSKIDEHLKKIDRSGLLPAGIILAGGGAGLRSIDEVAKKMLHLPSSIAAVSTREQVRSRDGRSLVKEKMLKEGPAWAVAYGLCILGNQSDDENLLSSSKQLMKNTTGKLSRIFRQFLP